MNSVRYHELVGRGTERWQGGQRGRLESGMPGGGGWLACGSQGAPRASDEWPFPASSATANASCVLSWCTGTPASSKSATRTLGLSSRSPKAMTSPSLTCGSQMNVAGERRCGLDDLGEQRGDLFGDLRAECHSLLKRPSLEMRVPLSQVPLRLPRSIWFECRARWGLCQADKLRQNIQMGKLRRQAGFAAPEGVVGEGPRSNLHGARAEGQMRDHGAPESSCPSPRSNAAQRGGKKPVPPREDVSGARPAIWRAMECRVERCCAPRCPKCTRRSLRIGPP